MTSSLKNDPVVLRNLAAMLTVLSGAGQGLSLWLLPLSPGSLMTALFGAAYLLLALGLFGRARFSLFLAIVILPMRSWFAWYPLEPHTWETLRAGLDIAIAALCVPVLWSALGPGYSGAPAGSAIDTEEAKAADV